MRRFRAGTSGHLARVAIAAGLTSYVLWQSDPAAIGRALSHADWQFAGAAILLVFADRALMAFRWVVLLRPFAATRPPFRAVLRVFFVSTFVGTFLPASVGGDAIRAYGLARHGIKLSESVASVLMDRVFGTLSILLVAAAAAPFAPASVPEWLPPAIAVIAVAASVGVVLSLFSRTLEHLARGALGRLRWSRLQKAAVSLLDALQGYRSHGLELLQVLVGSIAVQLLRVAQALLLGKALGMPLGPATYLIYVPVILLIMLLPVTVNGLGTSQWAFVTLFGESGVAPADAFALSVLFVALGIVGNLPGGLLYASGGVTGISGRVEDAMADTQPPRPGG